jgi:DNA helicase-2/ATP-dependent DNA helicase PcrA
MARGFVLSADDEAAGISEMAAFLSYAALEAGEGQGESWEDCVQLMTLHAAKGLEFPCVFMVGMEDGLFPSQRSIDEGGSAQLEEERRLAYVGITRARRHLTLSHAESRRMRGMETWNRPSRFISELPRSTITEVRPKAQFSRNTSFGERAPRPTAQDWGDEPGIALGSTVSHATFGEGVVIAAEGQGSHARVQVNFEGAGSKWLVLAYANLVVLG